MAKLPSFNKGGVWSDVTSRQWTELVSAVTKSMSIIGTDPIKVSQNNQGTTISIVDRSNNKDVIKQKFVCIRYIPNTEGFVLEVEDVVLKSSFSGVGDSQNLMRWVPLSEETGENPPRLQKMAVAPHFKAKDFELYVYPLGLTQSDRTLDILDARFILDMRGRGGWHVFPLYRLYTVKITNNAAVGACHPNEHIEGL